MITELLFLLSLCGQSYCLYAADCTITDEMVDCSNRRHLVIIPQITTLHRQLLLRKNRLEDQRITELLSRFDLRIPELLDLSGNVIEHLHIANDLSNLRTLILRGNRVRSTALADTLRSLASSAVRRISLVDNGIRELKASLQWPESLRYLDLSDNRVTSLNEASLHPLRRMVRLSIDGNRLTVLIDFAFVGMSALVDLSLNDNYISELSGLTFAGLRALERLSFERNRLTSVRGDQFSTLKSLQSLSLNGNRIKVLDSGSLSGLGVAELRLCAMDTLLAIERGALSGLTSLRKLDISNNVNLTYIDDDAFDALPTLIRLRLIDNARLAVLPATLDAKLPNVRYLLLEGNAYRCDCTAVWITRTLSAPISSPLRKILSRLKCSTPASLRGAPLSTTPTDKSCHARALVYPKRANVRLGESGSFSCRRIGVTYEGSKPVVVWRLPSGEWLNETRSNRVNYRLDLEGRLTVREARIRDQGEYGCAVGGGGGVIDVGRLIVRGGDLKLSWTTRTAHSLSVTWSRNERGAFDWTGYAIRCLKVALNQEYEIVKLSRIGAHTKSLTIGKLDPATSYRVCIVYYMRTDVPLETLDCVQSVTLTPDSATRGIWRIDVRPFICSALAVMASCVLCVAVSRCCNTRRRQRTYIAYPIKGSGNGGATRVATVQRQSGHVTQGEYADHEVAFFNSTSKSCLVG